MRKRRMWHCRDVHFIKRERKKKNRISIVFNKLNISCHHLEKITTATAKFPQCSLYFGVAYLSIFVAHLAEFSKFFSVFFFFFNIFNFINNVASWAFRRNKCPTTCSQDRVKFTLIKAIVCNFAHKQTSHDQFTIQDNKINNKKKKKNSQP